MSELGGLFFVGWKKLGRRGDEMKSFNLLILYFLREHRFSL